MTDDEPYDPRVPNHYEALEKAFEEAEAETNAERAARLKVDADTAAVHAQAANMAPLAGTVSAELTPEEMHRRRVLLSSHIGIDGAQQALDAQTAAAARAKASLGHDASATADGAESAGVLQPGGLLAPIAVGGSSSGAAGRGGAAVGSLVGRTAGDPTPGQKRGRPDAMNGGAAGGGSAGPMQLGQAKGKPSPVLLVRNAVHPGTNGQGFDQQLAHDFQEAARRHGAVLAVRLHACAPDTPRPSRAAIGAAVAEGTAAGRVAATGNRLAELRAKMAAKASGGAAPAAAAAPTEPATSPTTPGAPSAALGGPPATLTEVERYRVLMRLEDVASACKVADDLHGRRWTGRPLVVSFYSPALFDAGQYGPEADEGPLPSQVL